MRAMDCADYIVDQAIQIGNPLTNLQLQKALYVFAAEYMRLDNPYPYDEDEIMAWNYGPVIPEVYREYKSYESNPIDKVSAHEEFDIDKFDFVEHRYNTEEICLAYQDIVRDNLSNFLHLNIFDVVNFTHRQSFWKENEQSIYIHDNIPYPREEINLDGQSLEQFINNMRNL